MALTDQRIAVDGPLSHLASQLDHAFADHSIEVKRTWSPTGRYQLGITLDPAEAQRLLDLLKGINQ